VEELMRRAVLDSWFRRSVARDGCER